MKYRNRVRSVRTLEDYRVKLVFADGYVGELDLGQLAKNAKGPLEQPLRNPEFFREVEVKEGEITWPNGYDICADVLRYWCELGRVSSEQELRMYFAEPAAAQRTNA